MGTEEEDLKAFKKFQKATKDTPTDDQVSRLIRSLDAYKEMSGVLKDHYTVSEQKLQVAQMESNIASKTLQARQAELKAAQASGSLTEAEIENLSTQLATLRLLVKEKATMLDLQKDSHAAAGNVATEMREAMGIQTSWRKEMTGGFELAMREHGGLLAAMKAVTAELMTQITFADILGSTNQKLEFAILALIGAGIKQAFMFDQAISDFKTATGASDKYAASIQSTWEQTRFYGVSIDEATKSTQALYETYTDFTMLNSSSHTVLSRTSVLLDELGVSGQAFASGMQSATKSLGLTVNEAEETQRGLASFAMDLGVAPAKMAEGFNQAAPAMAKFTINAVQAFKNMALAAKRTGLEVSDIISFANKFDTFDGAAQQVGKLNAALGGDFVNSMDLMMAEDPTERLKMMKDAVVDSGRSFREMSYHERIFIADAMGLKDVNELALVMSGSMEDLNNITGKSAMSQAELAEQARNNMSLQEQWNGLVAEATPILIELIKPLRSIMSWISKYRNVIRKVLPMLFALRVATFAMSWASAATGMSLGKTVLVLGLLAAALGLAWYFLVHKKGSPTLLEGMVLFGLAIAAVWIAGKVLVPVINALSDAFVPFFTALAESVMWITALVGVVGIVAYVMGPEFWDAIAQSIGIVATAMGGLVNAFSELSLIKLAAFAATLTVSQTVAEAPGGLSALSMVTGVPIGGTGGAGTGGTAVAGGALPPVNVNVTVKLDKDVLAKHTEPIVWKMLNPARRG